MKRSNQLKIEEWLHEYPHMGEYIKNREQELMYPYRDEHDENVGGGRSNIPGKPVERMAITVADDRYLFNLKRIHGVLQESLSTLDPDTKKIVYELHLKEHPTLTMQGVCGELNISRAQGFKLRNRYFSELEKKTGLV